MNNARYTALFMGIVLALLALQAPLNWFCNPFEAFDHPRTKGLTDALPALSRRVTVPYESGHIRTEGIILGSSRALSMDCWAHFADERVRWTNLWINMATINEIRRVLQQAVAFSDLKVVVLGLDFEAFNTSVMQTGALESRVYALTQEGAYNPAHMLGLGEMLFSPATTKASLMVLAESTGMTKRAAALLPPVPAQADPLTGIDWAEFRLKHASNFGPLAKGYTFENMEKNLSSFDDFRAIVRLCQSRKVRLLVYTNPQHAFMLEEYRRHGAWPLFQTWLRKLAAIVAEQNAAVPDAPVALWNFAGYSALNTSYFGSSTDWSNEYFSDPHHFTGEVGRLILDRQTGKSLSKLPMPSDFGVVLTPGNVEQIIRDMEDGHARFVEHSKDWR